MRKKALILGAAGQAGSYLCEQLLGEGWHVFAAVRRSGQGNPRLNLLREAFQKTYSRGTDCDLTVLTADVTDPWSVTAALSVEPDWVFNLAAQSQVGVSFVEPEAAMRVCYGGVLNVLEGIRRMPRPARFWQASSSEMFGSAFSQQIEYSHGVAVLHSEDGDEVDGTWCYQNEETPLRPNSPYAVAKAAAHNLVSVYRRAYGLFACCGVLFNMESPRRSPEFVTRKISRFAGEVFRSRRDGTPTPRISLGNLDARRDWGWVPDYMKGARLMLEADTPGDYVFATGETHTVREFYLAALSEAGLGEEEALSLIDFDPALLRPSEVPYLRGDAGKAREALGWEPEVGFTEIVREMVRADCAA